MAREAHAERARRKRSVEEKQPSSFPSLPGPKAVQSFLAKSRIWEGDEESGQKRLAFLIEQIQEKNHIENAPNPTPSFVQPVYSPSLRPSSIAALIPTTPARADTHLRADMPTSFHIQAANQ
uniref:Uncharacterized protein n=1 Tax=Solanum lycopersicum TaxID=4081 RepID=A0A494G8Q8_SOLLC